MPAQPRRERKVSGRLLVATLAAVAFVYAMLARRRAEGTDQPSVELELELEVEVENLRLQLAEVDVEIKELLQKMESKRLEESDTKEGIAEARDRKQELLADLQKASDAYSDLLQSISSMFAQ